MVCLDGRIWQQEGGRFIASKCMRPLSSFEWILIYIMAILIVIFLTVGLPRKGVKNPCEIIELKGATDYKESCKNLKEWYGKST